jgi:hypothetical protein
MKVATLSVSIICLMMGRTGDDFYGQEAGFRRRDRRRRAIPARTRPSVGRRAFYRRFHGDVMISPKSFRH